jgi:hypothetical protein
VVAGAVQRTDYAFERRLIRVERNGEGMLFHVSRNGLNVADLFDGLTGLRRCSASDDPGCFQHIGDAFRNGASGNTDHGEK